MFNIYKKTTIFIVVSALYSSIFGYLGIAVSPIFAPLMFIYLSIGFTALLVLSNDKSLKYILKAPIYRWMLFYFVILLIWIMLPNAQASYKHIRQIILSIIVMFTITTLIFFDNDKLSITRKAILVATLIAIFNNLFEFFNPEAFFSENSKFNVLGRSSGFFINPNKSGRAIVLGMLLSIGFVHSKYKVAFLIISFLAVLTTFSRSGILSWFIVVFFLSITKEISRKQQIILGTILLTSITIAIPFLFNIIESQYEDGAARNLLARVSFFSGNGQEMDVSQIKRLEVATQALQIFIENPLIGGGIGFFENWEHNISTHNIYLQLLVEYGIIGIIIYPLLALISIWKATGKARQISYAFVTFALLSGLATHNNLESYHFLIAFPVMATLTYNSRKRIKDG